MAEHKQKKNEIYKEYKKQLADIEAITLNPMNPDGDANNWLTCITIDPKSHVTPDLLMDALEAENMESRPIWKPMHLQPVFKEYDYKNVIWSGDKLPCCPICRITPYESNFEIIDDNKKDLIEKR